MNKLFRRNWWTYTDDAKVIAQEVRQAIKPTIKKYSNYEEWNPIEIEHIVLSEVMTLLAESKLHIQVTEAKKLPRWRTFNGEYEKEWYDIQLFNGSIIRQCWPNAGIFHSPDQKQYSGSEIKSIKRCKHPLDEENV